MGGREATEDVGAGVVGVDTFSRTRMILWTLRGCSNPEGEFEGDEIVCAIEQSEDGYRLLLEHDGEIQLHESHGRIETAREKADILKKTLLKQECERTTKWVTDDGSLRQLIAEVTQAVDFLISQSSQRRMSPHIINKFAIRRRSLICRRTTAQYAFDGRSYMH